MPRADAAARAQPFLRLTPSEHRVLLHSGEASLKATRRLRARHGRGRSFWRGHTRHTDDDQEYRTSLPGLRALRWIVRRLRWFGLLVSCGVVQQQLDLAERRDRSKVGKRGRFSVD